MKKITVAALKAEGVIMCAAVGCERPAMIKKHGLCHAHYKRYRRNGTVGAAAIRPRVTIKPYKPTRKETTR